MRLNPNKDQSENERECDAELELTLTAALDAAFAPIDCYTAPNEQRRADARKKQLGRFDAIEGPDRIGKAYIEIAHNHRRKECGFGENEHQHAPAAR